MNIMHNSVNAVRLVPAVSFIIFPLFFLFNRKPVSHIHCFSFIFIHADYGNAVATRRCITNQRCINFPAGMFRPDQQVREFMGNSPVQHTGKFGGSVMVRVVVADVGPFLSLFTAFHGYTRKNTTQSIDDQRGFFVL